MAQFAQLSSVTNDDNPQKQTCLPKTKPIQILAVFSTKLKFIASTQNLNEIFKKNETMHEWVYLFFSLNNVL